MTGPTSCAARCRKRGDDNFRHPNVGNRPYPTRGNGNGQIYSPRGERGLGKSAPHVGGTFYDLGSGVHSQVCQFIKLHPHMSDIDVAVAFHWKVNQFDVARIRQAMQSKIGDPASDAIGRLKIDALATRPQKT